MVDSMFSGDNIPFGRPPKSGLLLPGDLNDALEKVIAPHMARLVPMQPDQLANYVNHFYQDKHLVLYGSEDTIRHIGALLVKKQNIMTAIANKQIGMTIDLKELACLPKMIKADFDHFFICNPIWDDEIEKISQALGRSPIYPPGRFSYHNYLAERNAPHIREDAVNFSTEHPNLILILNHTHKDIITRNARDLSKYFNLIKIYLQARTNEVIDDDRYFRQVIFLNSSQQLLNSL
jgi:hypothetical protein